VAEDIIIRMLHLKKVRKLTRMLKMAVSFDPAKDFVQE
jgi:hypothetical protein